MIKKAETEFKDQMERSMMEFLRLNGCKTFLGGSRRFGYGNERSDIDIMVHISGGWKNEMTLGSSLRALGFTPNYSPYENSSSSVWVLGTLFHLSIFMHEGAFRDLYDEHIKIETALRKAPLLKDFIISLKRNTNMTGATLYRMLRDTVLANA